MLYFNTNKPHSFFFWQNNSCIRKPQVISGGGAHPLHPPPRSAPAGPVHNTSSMDLGHISGPWTLSKLGGVLSTPYGGFSETNINSTGNQKMYIYIYILYRHECFTGKYTTRKIHKNYIRDPSSLFSIISHVSLLMT